jgi:hypothetical protein
MKRETRRVGIALAIVVALLVGGFCALKWSPLAAVSTDMHGRAMQGRFWFGLRDVGFGLSGTLVTTPVSDWSFANAVATVQVQTRPWWLIPYTVRTSIAASPDGQRLYLFSDYLAPAPGRPDLRERFPEGRQWNRAIMRDPRVRVKIGDRLFDFLAYPLTDVAEIEVGRAAILSKSTALQRDVEAPAGDRPRMYIVRLFPRWDASAIVAAHARAGSGLALVKAAGE